MRLSLKSSACSSLREFSGPQCRMPVLLMIGSTASCSQEGDMSTSSHQEGFCRSNSEMAPGCTPSRSRTLHTGICLPQSPRSFPPEALPLSSPVLGLGTISPAEENDSVVEPACQSALIRRSWWKRLSQYGCALTMTREGPAQPDGRAPQTLPAHINVCFACGRSAGSRSLGLQAFSVSGMSTPVLAVGK